MDVKYVKYGVANHFGSHIELSEDLKKFPALHDAVLAHELDHQFNKSFTVKEFMLDIRDPRINEYDLAKFIIKHPRSWTQVLPITITDKAVYYDLNMILTYSIFIASIVAGIYFIV